MLHHSPAIPRLSLFPSAAVRQAVGFILFPRRTVRKIVPLETCSVEGAAIMTSRSPRTECSDSNAEGITAAGVWCEGLGVGEWCERSARSECEDLSLSFVAHRYPSVHSSQFTTAAGRVGSHSIRLSATAPPTHPPPTRHPSVNRGKRHHAPRNITRFETFCAKVEGGAPAIYVSRGKCKNQCADATSGCAWSGGKFRRK
ncbi:hypothetical protein BZA05DRAFT_198604 [Tricharina praecox]|uniref:uncharacterized protein n=1 Tax=Tricharina praecox TaxID=43433 RepID=UPI00221F049C|nr:uncharacterized protein BZA05DRAFT_198604 [Tricharina praecox]KAI5856338.1 hypothetical protein BZA05DRAFT_198604 [Tricharina praecox]